MNRVLAFAVVAILVAGCAGSTATGSPDVSPATSPDGSPSAGPSESTGAEDADIVGSWHRLQTCEEMTAAFEAAGLAESHADWLNSNDLCVRGPLEHSHFFTADGQFGSHDENGQQVDDGDYVIVDADTLAFPSHASEFGYEPLEVEYAIEGDIATFDVSLPSPCDDSCKDAYAWALSAFASGPWARGEVP